MTTAYLDTVLIVGLAKSDLAPAELAAMFDLLELQKAGSVGLRTSPLAKEELSRHATSGRNVEEAIYMLLEDLPVVEEQFATAAMLGSLMFGANAGPIVKDELLGKLAEIGLQEDDARHVFQAARNDIDYFGPRPVDRKGPPAAARATPRPQTYETAPPSPT